jgi:glycosyltransferase involved in cell wall biosynthesis
MEKLPEGYIEKSQRKKILLLCDDIRLNSGIATMAREIVVGTSQRYNWVNLGAAINHPDFGKRLDLSDDTNKTMGINDSSVTLYPSNGYGTPEVVRQMIEIEKPDAIMLFTDPRYWTWLFQMENEIRKKLPIYYLSIWDDLPAPLYNKPYYESCDLLMSISKQTKVIHELVLGEKAKDKVITYVPHGINEKAFYPINEYMTEDYKILQEEKKAIFGENIPDFVVYYNARNIRRKCTSDLIAAYSLFCDSIGKEKAKKCTLLMHTQIMDENGTNLNAVVELLCDPDYQKVHFVQHMLPVNAMNRLYNMADVTALISSNEGWGLSLTESMMAGKMIIGNVTGGMSDQMRFEDENGDWVELSEEFPSNHYGTYKKCGRWAAPVFPTNLSIVGSIPTPYILDDRCDFRDVAKAIEEVYNLSPEERHTRGMEGRAWVQSDESNMSARRMCKNVISSIDTTFDTWKPKKSFELIKVTKLPRKNIKHKLVY